MDSFPQDMTQGDMQKPTVSGGKPYFMDKLGLVQFTSPEEGYGTDVYWLADSQDKTLRPFESETALQAAFGPGFEEAKANCVHLSPPTIDESNDIMDGVLTGFSILGPEHTIKEDGKIKKVEFSSHTLKKRYGKAVDPQKEDKAVRALEAFLNKLKSSSDKKIAPQFIDNLMQDDKVMAFFINALAYGNYTLSDVYSDILRRSRLSAVKTK